MDELHFWLILCRILDQAQNVSKTLYFCLSDAKWTSSSEGHQNCTYVKLHVPIPNERLEWAGDTQVERGSDVKVGIMLLADLRCVPELPLYCTMSWGHPTQ